jgi:Ni/Fe-hydrogenase subunit HybB-like protein
VVDVVIGSAFACGGFSVAMLVYIFNKGEYHPLVRPALLASLFGYTLAGLGSLRPRSLVEFLAHVVAGPMPTPIR